MEMREIASQPAPQTAASRDELLLSYYPLDDVWPMDPDGARVLAETATWLRDRLFRLLRRKGA